MTAPRETFDSSAVQTTAIYPTQDPKFDLFPSRRSVVHSTKGIVACSQPLAARAGIKVLEAGGNAADAAVAVAAALNVTEPCSTGIGGDMFCLFYDAKQKKTRALNGSGRTPAKSSLATIRKDLGLKDGELGGIPPDSVLSVTVPGAAAGWCDTVEKFGSGKVTMQQVLAPAIELAEEGFATSQISSVLWLTNEKRLKRNTPNHAELLKKDPNASGGCRAPRPGEFLSNPNLANTFRLLASQGKKGFYEGAVAEAIVEAIAEKRGYMSLDDLKKHGDMGSQEVDPISLKFSGQGMKEPIELWEHPPNGQGLIALIALGIFQELEKSGKIPTFTEKDRNSVEYLHALIESLRMAFSDGAWFIADPDVSKVPVEGLLSPSYLAERAAAFDPKDALQTIKYGNPGFSSSDTVYLSVTDSQGNAASFINSLYWSFGSGVVGKGTGFPLQCRGSNFALGPEDHLNVYAPSKRPFHTIIPAMITNANDGSLNTCYGVMGGYMQPQGHLQVLLNMFVFGMNPQEALDAPRICVEPPLNTGISEKGANEVIFVEQGMPAAVVEGLRRLGHRVDVLDGFHRARFGRGQVIRRNEDDGRTVWSAGSDHRGDGQAIPL